MSRTYLTRDVVLLSCPNRCPVSTHDDLRIRARQQDSQIQSLLAKFDDLHTDAKVNKWVQQSRQLGKLGYDEKIGKSCCAYLGIFS